MNFRKLLLLGILLLFVLDGQSQTAPKREFRGVWIATVKNIDFPARPGIPVDSLKMQWLDLLQRLKSLGFNAVVMQIRPAADAMYPSGLVPWSHWLTGKSGLAPDKEFDPLQYWIETAHNLGFEFHAWMNPYRATFDLDTASLSVNHIFNTHRHWCVRYGGRFYLNPALPEVQHHLTDIVTEVVKKYDVDAIHFDDYFYPYKEKDAVWDDAREYQRYGRFFNNIDDWRRNNVSYLIVSVSNAIKTNKPHVRFGISPFGVWRNKDKDFTGSDTKAGLTCYDDLYADTRLWLKSGWIDYVAPQFYWNIGYEPADYAKLVNWWSKEVGDHQLYAGHGIYKIANNPVQAWYNPREVPNQVALNRSVPEVDGSIFYSSNQVIKNPLGIADSLKGRIYAHQSLLPMQDTTGVKPSAPRLRCLKKRSDDVLLQWKKDKKSQAAYYAVYRFEGLKTGDWNDGKNLLAVTSRNGETLFVDATAQPGKTYTYAVTALNRNNWESSPSKARGILKKETGFKRKVVKKEQRKS